MGQSANSCRASSWPKDRNSLQIGMHDGAQFLSGLATDERRPDDRDVAEPRELAREWTEDEEAVSRRREPLTSVSMVFSMPPGTDPDGVYRSVRAFARVELEQFPYAMALHVDAKHPHVHLTIAARREGGARVHPIDEIATVHYQAATKW